MTNTLHRYGKAESFVDDYIVFSLPAKSKAAGQTGDALAAQKRFMQIAAEYRPCSLGDALHGGSLASHQEQEHFRPLGQAQQAELQEGAGRHEQGRHHGGGVRQAAKMPKPSSSASRKKIWACRSTSPPPSRMPRMPASSPAFRATPSPIRWASRKWATTCRASRPSCCPPCAAMACCPSTWRRR